MSEPIFIECDDCGQEFPSDGIFDTFSTWDDCVKHFCVPCWNAITDIAFV